MSFQVEKNFSVIFHLRPRLKMERASPKEPFIKYVRTIFQKTNIPNPLRRTRSCAYQGVRNVSFSESFAHGLNGWPL